MSGTCECPGAFSPRNGADKEILGQVFRAGLFFAVFSLLLQACFSPISRELRKEARKDANFPVVLRNPGAYEGASVIWGGIVIWAQARDGTGEITVLETPLQYPGIPASAGESRGRFLARISGVLDPAIYDRGTPITVGGRITGVERRPLGQIQYAYPVLDVKEVHVWKRDFLLARSLDFFWVDPFHTLQPPFWIYSNNP
jgi:outer membrane lipoprotein